MQVWRTLLNCIKWLATHIQSWLNSSNDKHILEQFNKSVYLLKGVWRESVDWFTNYIKQRIKRTALIFCKVNQAYCIVNTEANYSTGWG